MNYSKKEITDIVNNKISFRIIESDIKDKDLRNFIMNFDRINNLGYFPKKTVADGVDELIKVFNYYDPTTPYKVI